MTKPNEHQWTKKIKIVIIDLDGCLSDDRRRRFLLPKADGGEHGGYDAYHKDAINDPLLHYGHQVVREWHKDFVLNAESSADEGIIVFLTARPERHRINTESWLIKTAGVDLVAGLRYQTAGLRPGAFSLVMRSDDDKRKSPESKKAMLLKYTQDLYDNYGYDRVDVCAAYDDRKDVVEMWEKMGIPAFVCDENGLQQNKNKLRLAATMYPAVLRPQKVDIRPIIGLANPDPVMPPEIEEIAANLRGMAETLESRAADYGYNAVMVAQMMAVMFPKGVTLTTQADFEFWHLFELQIVKLTRFVNSGLKHKDSLHDGAIYSAFCERLLDKHGIKINK